MAQLDDGAELEVTITHPRTVVQTSGYPALARCAPEPHITIRSPMRGRLRALPRVA
jgi:hypothetical protein